MDIEITARHYDASDTVRSYVEKEVSRLEKFHEKILECKVILEKSKEGENIEIVLFLSGKTLSVSESSDEMIKSVDDAVKKMERQLRKFKGKRIAR